MINKKKPAKKSVKKPSKKKKKDTLLNSRKIKIRIVGIGGGAASILNEMASRLKKVSFLIADTDQRSFKKSHSKTRILPFGQELTRGWGTGMNPDIGRRAALESKEKIKKVFQDADLVILVSCLGGGVSSGASLIFSQILRELKILSLGIFTLPFNFEGEKKMRLAKNSLDELKKELSGVIVLPNEEILKYSDKKTSLQKSLSLVNQIFIDYFEDLVDTIFQPGIINIDFADLQTILKGRGQKVYFGRGIGQSVNRSEEALKQIFQSSFFDKPQKVKRILFNISTGGDLNLKEMEGIAQEIFELNPTAKIIFGISRDPKLNKKIKITFLGTGEDFEEERRNNLLKHDSIKGAPLLKERSSLDLGGKEGKKREKEKTGKEKEERKKKKEDSKTRKKESAKKKVKIRRSGLEIKKAEKEAQDKELFGESDWEVPAFLRGRNKEL